MGRRKQPQLTVVATRGRKLRQDVNQYILPQLQVGDSEVANVTNVPISNTAPLTLPDCVLLQHPHAEWLYFTHYDCIYADEMPNVNVTVGYIAAVNVINQGASIWCGVYDDGW